MDIYSCLNEVKTEIKSDFFNKNPHIIIKDGEPRGVYFSDNNVFEIYRNNDNEVLRIIYESFDKDFSKDFEIFVTRKFRKLSLMVDMARNNVMKVESIKKLIRYMSLLGYTTLKLYLEDLFEIKEEPYFGYLRGKYKKEELIEVVQYASKFSIDVIPCIQTLAHLNALKFFCPYRWNFDIDDILMVDSDITYRLIENMIKTLSEIFITDTINIGMDEAHHLGRGKYLDENGYVESSKIFTKHLKKVLEIAKKYNFKCEMWSDMFFNEKNKGIYDSFKKETNLNSDKDLTLVYRDYNALDEDYFDKNILKHKEISSNVSIAGATWKWLGFVPNNLYALENIQNFMNAGIKNNLEEFTLTAWGDNGGETPIWSVLPAISYAANFNIKEVKDPKNHLFKILTDKEFKNFMLLDEIARTRSEFDKTDLNSLNRIYMYNDILLGVYDTLVKKEQSDMYKKIAKKLKKEASDNTKFSYIFDMESKLAYFLSEKVNIGIYLRGRYKTKDKEGLKLGIKKLKSLDKKLDIFYDSFYLMWHQDSKANGFDVQDLRIGGIKQRIKSAIRKIDDYLLGKIDQIEELEEELLDFYGNVKDFYKPNDIVDPRYSHMSSVNVND